MVSIMQANKENFFFQLKWHRSEEESKIISDILSLAVPPIMVSKYSNVYQNVNIEFNPASLSSTRATIENQDITSMGVDLDISKEEDVDTDDKIHEENPYGDLPASNKLFPDISLRDLENEILEKSKEENDGFKKEYAVGVKCA